jgi:type IV pilus biogenesis protein CpaD/CtpE
MLRKKWVTKKWRSKRAENSLILPYFHGRSRHGEVNVFAPQNDEKEGRTFFWAKAVASLIGILLTGCEKQYLANDGYVPDAVVIEAKEVKTVHFFDTSLNSDINPTILVAMDKLLNDVRGEGVDNVGFMLVSDKLIPPETQERVKKQIYKLLYKNGFMSSRIVDSGVSVYKDAKTGVRIDVLRYDIKEPNCDLWSEYIGDMDTNKHLPKYGAADAYNFTEMIANKADLVSPRKYKGQEVKAAIAASAGGGSSSGSSSSSKSS